jgi:hypothetical protein
VKSSPKLGRYYGFEETQLGRYYGNVDWREDEDIDMRNALGHAHLLDGKRVVLIKNRKKDLTSQN